RRNKQVRKFIVPIRPEFHEKLFVGRHREQTLLKEHMGEFVIPGNTIEKAYVCNAPIKKIRAGDVVLFYRSRDLKAITSLGVVTQVSYDVEDAEKITRMVGKRTVYSKKEIQGIARSETLVLLFRLHFDLERSIELEELVDAHIIRSAPQSIGEISHDRFETFLKMSDIDDCYILH
ncbi:MAG: EVE domain-containing protein, partial [Candidatus Thorarchaeota archaeon]|nr:EVE domain-containing protein [Candidatus Thorarchaeota archaeon]